MNKTIATLMQEHKTALIIIIVILALLELEIFLVAAMKSGRNSRLQVMDQHGNVIHETDGKNLNDFNKYYFEKTFGPFENYHVKLVTQDNPFPFRAWLVAAVGIPMGIILLFAFVVKAYLSLLYGDEMSPQDGKTGQTGLERVVSAISSFNIFTIGFLVLLLVLSYWIIPNLVIYIGKLGAETLSSYKWVFISMAIVGVGMVVWVIYLKYLLAKKTIDSQTELNKFRLQIELHRSVSGPLQLEAGVVDKATPFLTMDEPKPNNPPAPGPAV